MKVTQKSFGKTAAGQEVLLFRLQNAQGAYVNILNYGCIIQAIVVPDKNGSPTDVCLGYDTLGEYERGDGFLGALVGRHANRIEGGCFVLGGTEYHLAVNNGPNHLHGGQKGFDRYVWEQKPAQDTLVLCRVSPHMEEGYPGNLAVQVAYRFTDENELCLEYTASSDADTVINLTNHAYFNLSGEGSSTVLNHRLQVMAQQYTENDENCLPTGVISPVEGTPFDFWQEKAVGRDIAAVNIQLGYGQGYDHNFVLVGGTELKTAARLVAPDTGITMETQTTLPGVQLYTCNGAVMRVGKAGHSYGKNSALCLETQYFPNAMRHTHFPSPILRVGQTYLQKTVYRFGAEAGR